MEKWCNRKRSCTWALRTIDRALCRAGCATCLRRSSAPAGWLQGHVALSLPPRRHHEPALGPAAPARQAHIALAAVATAARDPSSPHAGSTPEPSISPPWREYRGAPKDWHSALYTNHQDAFNQLLMPDHCYEERLEVDAINQALRLSHTPTSEMCIMLRDWRHPSLSRGYDAQALVSCLLGRLYQA